MKLYRFSTFKTSYFFPEVKKGEEFLYNLYGGFSGFLGRTYWKLFKTNALVRKITSVDSEDASFPYQRIMGLAGQNAKMSFGMGFGKTDEQKIAMLGIEPDGTRFFAKYSQTNKARTLTRNEFKVLTILQNSELTPKVYAFHDDEEGIFMKEEYFWGDKPSSIALTEQMVDYAIQLSSYHMEASEEVLHCGLKTCLSHGDYSPWNMLIHEGKLSLIDWETAAERPLGYDLFHFITQNSLLYTPEKPLAQAIEEHKVFLKRYFKTFGIQDYSPYLCSCAEMKAEWDESNGWNDRAEKLRKLKA